MLAEQVRDADEDLPKARPERAAPPGGEVALF